MFISWKRKRALSIHGTQGHKIILIFSFFELLRLNEKRGLSLNGGSSKAMENLRDERKGNEVPVLSYLTLSNSFVLCI